MCLEAHNHNHRPELAVSYTKTNILNSKGGPWGFVGTKIGPPPFLSEIAAIKGPQHGAPPQWLLPLEYPYSITIQTTF